MSKIALSPNASGTGVFTITSPSGNTDRTLTLPDEAGTVLTTAGIPTSAMPAGSVIQVVTAGYSIGATTVNGAAITIATATMSVRANSKVYAMFQTGQLEVNSTAINATVYIEVDGTVFTPNGGDGTNHMFLGLSARHAFTWSGITNPLTAGTHTFTVKGSTYGGNVTYNQQNKNQGLLVLMEVAA